MKLIPYSTCLSGGYVGLPLCYGNLLLCRSRLSLALRESSVGRGWLQCTLLHGMRCHCFYPTYHVVTGIYIYTSVWPREGNLSRWNRAANPKVGLQCYLTVSSLINKSIQTAQSTPSPHPLPHQKKKKKKKKKKKNWLKPCLKAVRKLSRQIIAPFWSYQLYQK